ncbi:MAG: DUF2490 domain-containing protein [Allomuricauda sp.]
MVVVKRLSFIALAILNLAATAQSYDEHDSGSWLEFYGDNKIHERWSIPLSGILHHHDLFEMHDFSFLRTGISYRLNPRLTVTGGIAFVNSKDYDESFRSSSIQQYWLYEEFSIKNKFRRNTLSHRWRLENRWINEPNKTYFRNRIRYRLQFSRPLYGKTFVKTFNEVFFNLNGPSFFNQNRFYLGIGQILTPTFKVDVGYLKTHFTKRKYGTFRMGLAYTIDFTRKEVASIDN